jgi:hypothetical protein
MKQLSSDVGLEESDRAADRGRRSSQASAGAGEAALVDGRDKDFHRVDAVHLFFRLKEDWPPGHRHLSAKRQDERLATAFARRLGYTPAV